MALVSTIYEPLITSDAICGRFLGDGREYTAGCRQNKFYFYAVDSPITRHSTTVDSSAYDQGSIITSIHALLTTGDTDYIVYTVANPELGTAIFLLRGLQSVQLAPPTTRDLEIFTSFKVRDYIAVFFNKELTMFKLEKPVYTIKNTFFDEYFALNDQYFMVSQNGTKWYLYEIATGKFSRPMRYIPDIVDMFCFNDKPMEHFLITRNSIIARITSTLYTPVTFDFKSSGQLVGIDHLNHTICLKRGHKILMITCGVTEENKPILTTSAEDESEFDNVIYPYLYSSSMKPPGLYKLARADTFTGRCTLVQEDTSIYTKNVFCTKKTPTGNIFLAKKDNKVFTISRCAQFSKNLVADCKTYEPLNKAFEIPEYGVLVVGEQTKFLSRSTLKEEKSWYRDLPTIYADETYQVSSHMVYTSSFELSCPLEDVISYTSRYGDDLVVCSTSGYAIIGMDSTCKGPTRQHGIIGAVEGGLVLNTGIKYFNNTFIPVKNILGAASVNEELIIVLLSGKVFLSKKGAPLKECDIFGGPYLSVKSYKEVIILESEFGKVAYKGGLFYNLKVEGSIVAIDSYLQSCLSIENGILYRETNISYSLMETPFKAALDTSTVLRTEACSEFIVSVCKSARDETAVHVYDIMKDQWKIYKKPLNPTDRAVVLDGRLVIISQESGSSALEVQMYNYTNLNACVSAINTSSNSELPRSLRSLSDMLIEVQDDKMEVQGCCNCKNACCSILISIKHKLLVCRSSIGCCNTRARGYAHSNQRYNLGNKLIERSINGFTVDFLSGPFPRITLKQYVNFQNYTRPGRKVLSYVFVQSHIDCAWLLGIYVYDEYPYKVEIIELYQYGGQRAIASFYMNCKPTIRYLGKQEVDGEIYPEFLITGNNVIKNVKILPWNIGNHVRKVQNEATNGYLSEYYSDIDGGLFMDIASTTDIESFPNGTKGGNSFYQLIRETLK